MDKQAAPTVAQQTDRDSSAPSKSYTLRYRAIEPGEPKRHNVESANRYPRLVLSVAMFFTVLLL